MTRYKRLEEKLTALEKRLAHVEYASFMYVPTPDKNVYSTPISEQVSVTEILGNLLHHLGLYVVISPATHRKISFAPTKKGKMEDKC